MVQYHWELDADTGATFADTVFHQYNAPEAAEAGHVHGQHLGQLLTATCEDLKRVHLVAHSAGAWVARSAAKWILKNAPSATVQITLLDPFVPSRVNSGSSLSAGNITNISSFENSHGLFHLENIYAIDNSGPIAGVSNNQRSDFTTIQ